MQGAGDIASAATATLLVATYFALLLYMTCWHNFECYFSSVPWCAVSEKAKKQVGKRAYQMKCPFTGLRPKYRCPSCACRVHDSAFHTADRFIALPYGETPLRWDLAKQATESNIDPPRARVVLDQALELRGNTVTQSVSGCCIACATWQKCFNMAPRLSLSLALASMFFAYVPWAFTSFLVLIGTGGSILKIISGTLSVALAFFALIIQLRAFGRMNAFLSKYSSVIPEFSPLWKVYESGVNAVINKTLFATRWDPLL